VRQTFEAIVIGGGIVGAAVAYRTAAMGLRVGVVCGGRPGAGTSGASLAWLNSAEKRPLGYHRLNVAGTQEWRALVEEVGLHGHVHFDGSLTWAEDEPGRGALREQVARLRRWGYEVEIVSPAQARRHWAPELCLDLERVGEVAVMPDEGWVETRPVIAALFARVARAPGSTVSPASAIAIHREGERVVGIDTSEGERWDAGIVLNCAGPQADTVTQMAGATLPLRREPGTLIVTEPLPTLLRPVVHAPVARFRPDGGGRVMLLGIDPSAPCSRLPSSAGVTTPLPETERGEHDIGPPGLPLSVSGRGEGGGVKALLDAVADYLPVLRGASVEAARVGVRPMPPDGLPIVGFVPGLDRFYVVVTHSGVTLGPLLGRLVAQEVRDGATEARLAPYRPERFARLPRQ
jgi:glycine/D-amino acid oxidase-like deaminating enzyme